MGREPFVIVDVWRPRWLLAVALTLLAAPAAAQGRFRCPEVAAECVDLEDPATCTDLPDLRRRAPDQLIVRAVEVAEGPFAGVELRALAGSAAEDAVFASARDRLCLRPAPAPPPPGSPTDDVPPTIGGGPVWYGGSPGIYLYRR